MLGVKLFGIPLGGIDRRFKRGEFYPGAMQFTFELSSYNGANNKPVDPLPVAVITARAKELKFALALRQRGKLCSAYRRIGEINGKGNWGIDTVFYGSIVEWLFWSRKGISAYSRILSFFLCLLIIFLSNLIGKFKNFEKLLKQDADSKISNNNYIFIGDTGK